MNGFRRFWNKTCKESLSRDSPLGSLIKKEFMMGHTGLIKLDKNYFKTHTLELAEEYLNAIPNLTISNEKRLRLENKKKTEKIAKLERQQKEIDFLKQEVRRIDLRAKITEEIKQGMIEWAEHHPHQVPPIKMAKVNVSKSSGLDEMVTHFLEEHDGNINGLRERFANHAKITTLDD